MPRQSEAFDPDIERLLLEIAPYAVRKEGGTALQDAIRAVWMHGELFGESVGRRKVAEQAARGIHTPSTGKLESAALEAERVWGFDVGYAVATAKLASSLPPPSSQAAHSIPLPAPSSYVVQSVQTEPPPALPASPTPSALAPSIPAIIDVASKSIPLPRDLSALSSGSRRPFGSLQRRRCRQRNAATVALRQAIPSSSCVKKGISSPRVVQPHSRSAGLPRHSHSAPLHHSSHPTHRPPLRKSPPLDWEHDPRLRDLGGALTALGWMRG
ncbi:hypothetical protein C8F01DRAFT_1115471 [Mycena amicta]|nr:hypothetical protein C8F01DRAFT_1115471 [Mycena amicta]